MKAIERKFHILPIPSLPKGEAKYTVLMRLRLFLLALLFTLRYKLMAQDSVTILVKSSQELFNAGKKYREALGAALRALGKAEKQDNPACSSRPTCRWELCTITTNNQTKEDTAILLQGKGYRRKIPFRYHRFAHIPQHRSLLHRKQERRLRGILHEKAVSAIKAIGDYNRLSKSYAVLTELYKLRMDDTAKIMPVVKEAYRYALLAGDSEQVAFALMKYGFYYYDQKMFKRSLPYFYRAKNIYGKLNDLQGLSYATRT